MVQNRFSWEMFWQAASAIATTAAVIVALWQTRYQNKKKLKIGFTEDMTYIPIGGCGTVKKNQYFEINVVNVGNRKVYIEHFGVLGKDEDGLRERIIQPSEPFGRPIIFPYELDIEQGLSCPLEKSVFLANLKKGNLLDESQKLVFYAKDSTGEFYTCQSTKTLQQYFDEYKITDVK